MPQILLPHRKRNQINLQPRYLDKGLGEQELRLERRLLDQHLGRHLLDQHLGRLVGLDRDRSQQLRHNLIRQPLEVLVRLNNLLV